MRRTLFICLFLMSTLAMAGFAAEMTGYITCEKCKHVAAKDMGCAKGCVRGGVKAVFYDSATKKFYTVANQDAVKQHAGQEVVVNGDVSGDTLTVESIKPASGKS